MFVLDRLGVRWTLALLAVLPLCLLVVLAWVVVDDAHERADAVATQQAAIERVEAIGGFQIAVVAEGALHGVRLDGVIDDSNPLAGLAVSVMANEFAVGTDWTYELATEVDLEPALQVQIDGMYADIVALRDRASPDPEAARQADELQARVRALSDAGELRRAREEAGQLLHVLAIQEFGISLSSESIAGSRLQAIGGATPAEAADFERLAAATDADVDHLSSLLTADAWEDLAEIYQDSAFDEIRARVRQLPTDGTRAPMPTGELVDLIGTAVTETTLLLERGEVMSGIVDDLALDASDQAIARRNLVVAAVVTASLLTVAGMWFFARRFSRRLDRVANVADAVSAGELDAHSIDDPGRDQLGALAGAVDEMTAVLAIVQRQLGAMADERYDDDVLSAEVPGTVGRNLRSAIRRVTNNTDQLRRQADTDHLTGLLNRRALEQQVTELLGLAWVVVIDLDGFKEINDTLGHHTGDEVLIGVARLLTSSVRSDDLVCRAGGDEFIIAMTGSWVEVTETAERVQRRLEETITTSAGEIGVGASIGVVAIEETDTFDRALRRADKAMYDAKRAGKGRVVVG
ncbi:MAG: diguanylate cyclase [Actinomycetota bacterium]